jgi:hypothetical protein
MIDTKTSVTPRVMTVQPEPLTKLLEEENFPAQTDFQGVPARSLGARVLFWLGFMVIVAVIFLLQVRVMAFAPGFEKKILLFALTAIEIGLLMGWGALIGK